MFFIIIQTTYFCSPKIYFHKIEDISAQKINTQTKNEFFEPENNYNPIFVRANFIFLLDEKGEGNFNGKNDEDTVMYNTIFMSVNKLYSSLKNPKDSICYKGNDFIKDTKIQFKFKSLYIKDSFARNYRNAPGFSDKKRNYGIFTPSNKWYLKYLDNKINDTITHKGINAFFNMDALAYNDLINHNSEKGYKETLAISVSQFPSYTNLYRSSQVCFPNKYTKRLWMEKIYSKKNNISWDKKVKYWYINSFKGIGHELGHSLGLAHSNKHHGRNKCKSALMNQGKSPNNYIPPSEIGKMHKALMTSNLIQYVTENSNFGVPRLITENENWSFKTIRFYQDIIVKEDKILIFNGNVILPPDAKITLEKNAILVLNKANIKTATNKPFINIIKKKHAKVIEY